MFGQEEEEEEEKEEEEEEEGVASEFVGVAVVLVVSEGVTVVSTPVPIILMTAH